MPDKAAYYGNRAAAYMMINNYMNALEDSTKSVEKDPNFFKVKCKGVMTPILLDPMDR